MKFLVQRAPQTIRCPGEGYKSSDLTALQTGGNFFWGSINATQESIKILEDPIVEIQRKDGSTEGRRGNDDLGPVTDRTYRVQGRIVTVSPRGSTPAPLSASFYHDTSAPESSTQPPPVTFRSRPHIPSHLSHTPVPYEAYGSVHPHSQPPPAVFDPYLAAPTVPPHIPYRSSAQAPSTEFSDSVRQLGAEFFEQMIGREEDKRVHAGSGDGLNDDDGDDDGEDVGDEEQSFSLATVAPASGSNGRPRYRKGKGLTGSFMSVMGKISGSRNNRPDKARDVTAPTQRKYGFTCTFLCSHLRLDRSLSPAGPTSSSIPCWDTKLSIKLLDIRLQLDIMSTEENLLNIPCGFHVPIDPPMPDRALLDLIAHEARREDAEKEEKFDRIVDLLSRYYRDT
ncbi:hypothetical protein M9H77_09501 [Catharanthus roseus]|uniref:Uncharacterized protein n=1 Tax=Catharanthus roseus TaxID=4058 RepID=A0ACC0C173_CATRO|nr:hypothetical protein M9H77_09501 [Catharanthus roseus]